jgi:NAD(P)H-hydrate epimerase
MHLFTTAMGIPVPDVSGERMRELDRIAMEEFGIDLLQMMENAGRTLADAVRGMLDGGRGVTVVAGSGGNGGGGLAAARHLHGRGVPVRVVRSRPEGDLAPATKRQLAILRAAGVPDGGPDEARAWISDASVAIDALIGYGLRAPADGVGAELIRAMNRYARRIVSLDLPSGLDATRGAIGGPVVRPARTVTLALPKTGLADAAADLADLWLADLGIPPEAVRRLGFADYASPFFSEPRALLRCHVAGAGRCREAARGGEAGRPPGREG